MRKSICCLSLFALLSLWLLPSTRTFAQEGAPEAKPAAAAPAAEVPATPGDKLPDANYYRAEDYTLTVAADTAWVLISAFLVFFMNTGFGCVEAGFCRSKNAVNILGKNFITFAIATVCFWAVGFAFMFSDGGSLHSLLGLKGWFLSGEDNSPRIADAYAGVYTGINWSPVPLNAKFFFQLAFAATAATIVSGCVAERIHYRSFMIFAALLTLFAYPITGHWVWGGGWLSEKGFFDFAGSTVVHSVGGWAGLMAILFLGPRIGKYSSSGPRVIPGHSMSLVFLGGMILWLGWFGFNPGSTMMISGTNAWTAAHIVVTTNMGCAAGMLVATLTARILSGTPDFSMSVNGALAGLVAVTAGCAWVTVSGALIIGGIGGFLVVVAVSFFDKLRLDDPVGALSVHLVNGIWGTLAIGLFAAKETLNYDGGPKSGLFMGGGLDQLISQLIGIGAVGAYTLAFSALAWGLIYVTCGMRVDEHHEVKGLDLSEMGMEAYPIDTTS